MSESASWLYAVLPGEASDLPTGLRGVMGESVRLLPSAGLTAVVGSVPAEQVADAALQHRLADPHWLEHAARTHHEVITTCFAQLPTVPFRLATVYHQDWKVAELLEQQGPTLRKALDTAAGRAEWGVQAHATQPAAAAGGGESGSSERASSGTDYLRQRRARREEQERSRIAVNQAVHELDAALARLAVAVHQAPAPRRTGETGSEPLVLNAAYLVEDADAERFVSTVHDLMGQLPQLRLRLTGPWPPYSFVTTDGAA